MKLTEEQIRARLQEAAGEGLPVVAAGLGTVGPSLYTVWSLALVVLALGLAIAIFTYHSWIGAGIAVALAVAVFLWLRSRVTFCLVGVSPRHFIVIDLDRRGRLLPPALQGLSAIQFPKVRDKELSTILHYVLGDGTINDIRFQDFRRLPDNRAAARRLKQAVMENV